MDVKPNRGDALSILGLAREVAAATRQQVRQPAITVEEGSGPATRDRLAVVVEDPELCPRFVGRWVSGVRVGPSPDAVQMRLLAAGQRPISNVVDASNYVMLELGKPIHTFDAAAVRAGADGRPTIVVRRAAPGERLQTLDHVDRELSTDTLLIADPAGPLAVAGVMGGADSEVSDGTTDVVVESAIFDPVSIRRTARRLALRSEASSRFEHGQESRLARLGADRTAQLLRDWAGGEIAPGVVDTAPDEPARARVAFRPARINRLLGTDLSSVEQRELLARVGIDTEPAGPSEPVMIALAPAPLAVASDPGGAVSALVPTWRRDIAVEADVAEEIARVRGYELVPSVTPDTTMPAYRPSPLAVRELVRETLAGAGLTEVVTSALVSPRHHETFAMRREVPSVGRRRPAGRRRDRRDQPAVARPLAAAPEPRRQPARRGRGQPAPRDRRRRGVRDRQGLRPDRRRRRASGGAWASRSPEPPSRPRGTAPPARSTSTTPRASSSWSARRAGLDRPVYEAETDEPLFHPGRTARASAGGDLHAIVGELHPDLVERWGLRTTQRVVVAEIALRGLAAGRLAPERAGAVARFPEVERDLAIVVPEATPAAVVDALMRDHAGALLRDVALFDIYRGVPLGLGREEPGVPAAARGGRPDPHRAGGGRGGGGRRGRAAGDRRSPPRLVGPWAHAWLRAPRCRAARRAVTLADATRAGTRPPTRRGRTHWWTSRASSPP